MSQKREVSLPSDTKELIREEVLRKMALGWLGILGPVTASSLGERTGLPASEIWKAMLLLEASGTVLRGVFEGKPQRRLQMQTLNGANDGCCSESTSGLSGRCGN
jgi:hypothetical protein